MTRHELAKLRLHQLASTLKLGADENGSDQLEAWLRDDVVPVVEDLLKNPAFRRRVQEMPEQLFGASSANRRTRLQALADALVTEAGTLVEAACEFDLVELLQDQDRALDQAWIDAGRACGLDTRSVIEKLAERPWFDLANPEDFWSPSMDLYLRRPDALLTRQYRRMRSEWKMLGDHVIDLMFVRLEFWKKRIDHVRHQLQFRPQAEKVSFAARERMFGCAIDVDQKYRDVRSDWREGEEPRLRNACSVLLQSYIAYHEAPRLDWLGFSSQSLTVYGGMVRTRFRHRGTLRVVEQRGDGRLHEIESRTASLVDVHLVKQVAQALEDLAALYHRGVHPDDLIAEAKDQFRLVVVVHPRMVFWNGDLVDLPWASAEKSWNLLLHLAVKAEGKLPLHDFALSGVMTSRALTIRKSRLEEFLSRIGNGAELAARIDRVRKVECRLELDPSEVKVLDLQADEWTVDVSEFQANSY